MLNITYALLDNEIKQFKKNCSFSSRVFGQSVVIKCEALLQGKTSDQLSDRLSEEDGWKLFLIIFANTTLTATEALSRKTATAIFLRNIRNKVLEKIADKNRNSVCELLQYYSKGSLFSNSEDARANFEAITQGDGEHAKNIAMALSALDFMNLLEGENAQANRQAITQEGESMRRILRGL